MKVDNFDGLQTRQPSKVTHFRNFMTGLMVWIAFLSLMENFLGNRKPENYIEPVEKLFLHLKIVPN